MTVVKRDPQDLYASRKARLVRLINMDAPPAIIAAQVRILIRSLRHIEGRRWGLLSRSTRVRVWLNHVLPRLYRCECGGIIWPWNKWGYDPELMKRLHWECGDTETSGVQANGGDRG